jgi:hypothetical protein
MDNFDLFDGAALHTLTGNAIGLVLDKLFKSYELCARACACALGAS